MGLCLRLGLLAVPEGTPNNWPGNALDEEKALSSYVDRE